MKLFISILTILLIGASQAISCTIFKSTHSEKTLIGNSEDWREANAKVWFLSAVPGKHGRVFFGFENGWAQGGMNDQGLFFDGIAGETQDWVSVAHREDFPGNLCEKILEEAVTVEDAIAYFKRYNFPSLVVGTFVFVDATGSTATISYAGGRLKVDSFSASTFARGYRGDKARDLLDRMGSIDIPAMEQILNDCQRRDHYPTQYGNIYDPHGLEVHFYANQGSVREITFDLVNELAKGDHYYDLENLSENVNMGLAVDHKTRSALPHASALDEYVGQYGLDTKSLKITSSGNYLLLRSELIFDAVMAFEIVLVGDDQFVARHLAIEANFQRDRQGNITSMSVDYDGSVFSGLKRK